VAPPEPTVAGPLRIGRYEVLGHLATGGMAQIFLARQTGLGSFERHVVLKTILRERAADQRFVTMFLDEAKLAATLNHQNVAQVYEVDQADGAYFMAMEYVHGENTRAILETTIRRGWTIPLELAVMIISGAAAGLHHAHERRGKNGQPLNIVHRDVSPANIMVGYDGSVKVLDFGIAKAEERATKTIGGTIKGKYGYMSPEQCKGKPIDRRSDIFALGIVLYELTTLRRAFKGNDDFETMKRIVAGDLVLPSTVVPGFPRELEAIILTALAPDPGARFQTGQELIEALDAFTVRAKLTGSNTAMGRFMLQLFGTKKEPWIDAAVQSSDHTLVTPAELDDYEDDNDETLVISNRQDVQRALDHLNIPARPPVTGAHPAPRPSSPDAEGAARPAPAPTKRPSARRSAERPSLPFASPTADRPVPAIAPEPSRPSSPHLAMTLIGPTPLTAEQVAQAGGPVMLVPAAAMQGGSPHGAGGTAVPTGAMGAGAPGPSGPIAANAPTGSMATAMPVAAMGATTLVAPPGSAMLPPHPGPSPGMASGAHPAPPSGAHPAAPPSGPHPAPHPAPPPPASASGLPSLVSSDDISEIGARPLVTDPKLGWATSVQLMAPSDGGHTRLPSDVVDYRIRSSAKWWLLAVVLLLAVVALLAVIAET
jgi:serine/threonine-protein kinase